jgi:uroporphyrinogen decarboxylase
MNPPPMTSLERVLTTLSHREPDRVPLFLLTTMHGAKELGMTIEKYFSRAENVAKGQLGLRAKYGHDCLYAFFHASLELEAFGGETIFRTDGPPTAGEPVIKQPEDIRSLGVPEVSKCAPLLKVLEAIRLLKARVGMEAPIIGVVMSPVSLPIMQMGFEGWLDLMYERPELVDRLIAINEAFCVAWANAQLAAGATAICYFDPASSSTIVSPEQYLKYGYQIARRVLPQINGPTATHFASGRCLPIVQDVAKTGTAVIGVSVDEDLAVVKNEVRGRVSIMGNLNGIEMRRWSAAQAEEEVKKAIGKAGPGGGFILTDNHGEIPFQVPDDILMAIADAARTWGRYPIAC